MDLIKNLQTRILCYEPREYSGEQSGGDPHEHLVGVRMLQDYRCQCFILLILVP